MHDREQPIGKTLGTMVAVLLLTSTLFATPTQLNTRDMLRLLGVEDSHLSALVDGRPVDAEEGEAFLRMMFAAARFDTLHLHRWIRNEVTVDDLASQPSTWRGEIVRLQGRIVGLSVEQPATELATRFEIASFYRCSVRLQPSGVQAVVYSTVIPKAWSVGEDLDEPISFVGFFIKNASETNDDPQPVFVASRMAWHPTTTLGKLKMDVGLFDTITDRSRISAAERECFYQLLAAAGRADMKRFVRLTPDDFPVAPLFNSPELQRGRLVALRGVARRITKIIVDDADIVERFGIDHYYEVAVFSDDSQGNPVIFCLRQLPPGMPTGERISEAVRIPAFFLKTWTFETAQLNQTVTTADDEPRQRKKNLRQVAPLLIGKSLLWYTPPEPEVPGVSGWITGTLFLLALAGVWFGLWRRHVADRTYARGTLARARDLDSDSPLDTSGID